MPAPRNMPQFMAGRHMLDNKNMFISNDKLNKKKSEQDQQNPSTKAKPIKL